MILVPDRSGRSNARTRVSRLLRELRIQLSVGQEPLQRTVTFAGRGACTDSSETRAPLAVSRPRMRTTGNGLIAFRREAELCSTWPLVGTGVLAGAAVSNVRVGVGSGVGTGVGIGTGVGCGTGLGVGAGVGAAAT